MHTSLLPVASLLMRSLGWALLYSLWQGLIIYLALLFLLRIFKNVSAQVKYYLAFISFSTLCIWFIDTWINQWQRLQVNTVFITQSTDNVPGITHTLSVPALPQYSQMYIMNNILPHLEAYMPLIISAYILGLLFMLLRFCINLWQVHTLRRQGLAKADSDLYQRLAYWQNQLDISRPIRLYLSDRIHVPAMMGVIKPVILLPLATISQLSADQLEAILIHELAHIKRHDYLLNILQTVVETVLFFNPFVCWMSAIIRREREHCCDDIVVSHTSYALSYAKALAQLESHRTITSTMALAVTGRKNQLFNRIKRIMEMKKSSVSYSQLSIALVVIVALVISIAWFTPSYAQHAKTDHQKDSTAKKSEWHFDETYTFIDDNGNKKVYHSYDDIPEDKRKLITDGDTHQHTKQKVIVKTIDDNKISGDNEDDMPDMQQMGKTIAAAMSEVDWDKMGSEIGDAVKDLHLENFNAKRISDKEYQQITDSIDWVKIQKDIQKAMKEVEKSIPDEKTRKEVSIRLKKELDKVHYQAEETKERVRTQVEKAQDREEKANARAGKTKTIIITKDGDGEDDGTTIKAKKIKIDNDDDESVVVANGSTNLKARHIIINNDDNDKVAIVRPDGNQNGSYEKMLNRMQDDDLIDRSEDFKIEMYDDVLYINGNQQPVSVYKKYKHFMNGRKVIIKGGANHLNIKVKD